MFVVYVSAKYTVLKNRLEINAGLGKEGRFPVLNGDNNVLQLKSTDFLLLLIIMLLLDSRILKTSVPVMSMMRRRPIDIIKVLEAGL